MLVRGVHCSQDFSKEAGATLCHTQCTFQIGMSTTTPCFTKSEIFWVSSERGGSDKPTK